MSVFHNAVSDVESYETGLFLAAVAEIIRTKGFSKQSTGRDACELVIKNRDEGHEFAVEDFVTAGLAIGWLANKEVLGSFEREVYAACQQTHLRVRQLNLVMYAVKMYNDIKDVDAGEHIGAVKERLTLKVDVKSSEFKTSEWGDSYQTKGVTPEGNVVLWYAKEQLSGPVTITGTVTKHTEFGGVKTTHLNRVKVA